MLKSLPIFYYLCVAIFQTANMQQNCILKCIQQGLGKTVYVHNDQLQNSLTIQSWRNFMDFKIKNLKHKKVMITENNAPESLSLVFNDR